MDVKKAAKTVVMSLLSLVAMALCGTFVLWVYYSIMGRSMDGIWLDGFQAGFIAWILEIVWNTVRKLKKKKAELIQSQAVKLPLGFSYSLCNLGRMCYDSVRNLPWRDLYAGFHSDRLCRACGESG